jgi:hypothetical protein
MHEVLTEPSSNHSLPSHGFLIRYERDGWRERFERKVHLGSVDPTSDVFLFASLDCFHFGVQQSRRTHIATVDSSPDCAMDLKAHKCL